jgi:hypothetical protein
MQGERKVALCVLKYLSMFAVKNSSIGLMNTRTVVTVQQPKQATPCGNPLASVRQLCSNGRSTRMYFSQVQRVLIVEHYLASYSYLAYKNKLRDTFSDFPVPSTSTLSRLLNCFQSLQKIHRLASYMRKKANG